MMCMDQLSLLLLKKLGQTDFSSEDLIKVVSVIAPEEETTVFTEPQMGVITIIEVEEV